MFYLCSEIFDLKKNKDFIKTFCSWALLIIFLLPTGLRTIDFLHKHEHDFCSEKSVHFHKQNDECATCDFSFSSFEFKLDKNLYLFNDTFFINTLSIYKEIYYLSSISTIELRGPPINV